MNSQFLNFFKEMVLRLFGPTPMFFKIIAAVGAVATFIGFVPEILTWLNLAVPDRFAGAYTLILKIAGALVALVALFSTPSTPVATTSNATITPLRLVDSGTVLKATDEKSLPFTAKSEEKKAAKLDLPTVRVLGNSNSNAGGI